MLNSVLICVPSAEPIRITTRAPARPSEFIPIKLKQMQVAKQLGDRIAALESEIQQSELALSDFAGADEAARLSNLLEAQRAELQTAMSEWEQVTEQIEATA